MIKSYFGWFLLRSSIIYNNEAISILLIEKGVKINSAYEKGLTLLMHASYRSSTAVVEKLIKNGASIDAQSDRGTTALILAIQGKNHGAMQLLIKRGADVDLKNRKGKCAYDYRRLSENASLINLLENESSWNTLNKVVTN